MESVLTCENNVLVWLNPKQGEGEEIRNKFFGKVLTTEQEVQGFDFENKNIYLCGEAARALSYIENTPVTVVGSVNIVHDYLQLQSGFPNGNLIRAGQVPLSVHGLGVFFPEIDRDSFDLLGGGHELQDLRESDKEGVSLRKGMYLSNVVQHETGDSEFNILRCSTNLDGPTEQFSVHEQELLANLNNKAHHNFKDAAPVNHILKQRYDNKDNKKGSIKDHSDKTEDMPANGIMAFVTTYDPSTMPAGAKKVGYDWQMNTISLLTRLRFCLKQGLEPSVEHPAKFDVLLYPGSVLMIPLSTNRLYTHTIKPSALPADKIPVRTSLVCRCSKTRVVHRAAEGVNYIVDNETGEQVAMRPIDEEGKEWMRNKYYEENLTTNVVDYGKKPIPFSMNKGDYLKPVAQKTNTSATA